MYCPVLDHVAGRLYGLWVHGNNDTVDAVSSVDKTVREPAYGLGGTLAAVLME